MPLAALPGGPDRKLEGRALEGRADWDVHRAPGLVRIGRRWVFCSECRELPGPRHREQGLRHRCVAKGLLDLADEPRDAL